MKIKKISSCFIMIIIVMGISIVQADNYNQVFQRDFANIIINGDYAKLYNDVVYIDDRAYVQLRELGNILQVDVGWSEEDQLPKMSTAKTPHVISDDEETENRIKNEGVVADKETAYNVGKAILEGITNKNMVFTDGDVSSDIFVVDHSGDDTQWVIYQRLSYKGQWFKFRDEMKNKGITCQYIIPYLHLDKRSGEVVEIWTDSTVDEIVEGFRKTDK